MPSVAMLVTGRCVVRSKVFLLRKKMFELVETVMLSVVKYLSRFAGAVQRSGEMLNCIRYDGRKGFLVN